MELILQVELVRESLRRKMLRMVSSNGYHFIGAVLALIFAGGTVGTAFVSLPISLPIGGYAYVVFVVTGILSVLTVVLLPLGLVLL